MFISSWLWYICIHCCLLNACFFLRYSACAINNCIFVFITLLLLFQFLFTKPDLNDNGKISRRTILINCLVFNAIFSWISVISWHAEQYHQFGLSKYHQNKIKRSEKHEHQKILRPIPGVLKKNYVPYMEPVVKSRFTNQFCGVSGIIVTSQTCLMELFAKHSNNLKSVVFPWRVKRQMENGLSLGEHI